MSRAPERSEPGGDFGAARLLNRDGTFNIHRHGLRRVQLRDLYHSLLLMRWRVFLALIVAVDLLVNLVFGIGYFLCGPEALQGIVPGGQWERLGQDFFFSVQTFATIGYGHIRPVGLAANSLVTFEAILSLLSTGLVTGILFARFARPTARVVFSNVAIISVHDGIPSLLFRLGNRRLNQILEARVHVSLSRIERTAEGETYRTFEDLRLERAMTPIFALTWTVVHPITPESPLYGKSADDLRRSRAELVVSLVGIDDTFAQSIYSRFSYTVDEILWDRRFQDILGRAPDGKVMVDLARIHDVI